jgi:4-amino-4-deoxy-L-arabinose transferase-like glycosyltransferase
VTQTVGRSATPWHHSTPFWYYLQVMATLWLPLVLLLPWLVPRWREALRARDARVLLPLGFVVVYVLFFSTTSGKRDLYILPALPMLALPAGYLLPELLRRVGVQRTLAALVLLLAVVTGAGALWLSVIDPVRGRALLAQGGVASVAPLVVLSLVAVAALIAAGWMRAHLALAATLTAAWLIAGFWVFPQMDGERSARNFIAKLEQVADPARELGLLAYHEHFLWHLKRPSINFGHRRFREGDQEMYDAAAWLAAQPGRQLLVPERMLAPCFTGAARAREVGNSSMGAWFLVEGVPMPSCVARGDAGRSLYYQP